MAYFDDYSWVGRGDESLPASGVDNAIWAVAKKAREWEEKYHRLNVQNRTEICDLKKRFESLLKACFRYMENENRGEFAEAVNSANFGNEFYLKPKVNPEFHPERELAHFCGNAIRVECPVCKAKPKEKCVWPGMYLVYDGKDIRYDHQRPFSKDSLGNIELTYY